MACFDKLYGQLCALADGSVVKQTSQAITALEEGASYAEDILTLNVFGTELKVGKLAAGIIKLGIWWDERCERMSAARMLRAFQSETPLKRMHVLDAFGRRVAVQYRQVLSRMSSGGQNSGPLLMARCVVNRCVRYITRRDSHQIAREDGFFARWWNRWRLGVYKPTSTKPLEFLLQHGLASSTKEDEDDPDRKIVKVRDSLWGHRLGSNEGWEIGSVLDCHGLYWPHNNVRMVRPHPAFYPLIAHLGYREVDEDEPVPEDMKDVTLIVSEAAPEDRDQFTQWLIIEPAKA
jgi:hypothetical protein